MNNYHQQLTELLDLVGVPSSARVSISGDDPVIPSRFRIGRGAALALAACGTAADRIWQLSGGAPQDVSVDVRGAAFSLISFLCQRLEDNSQPERDPDRPLVAMYPTADGRWIHLHGAFPALADGTLDVLGCENTRESVASAVLRWQAQALEDALAERGLCGAMVRTRDEWLAHEQGIALSHEPVIRITRLGDSSAEALPARSRPLENIRVLDLTRVLAGPTCGRTLAAHGADVLKINSPNLPSVPPFVMDTGHGKRSAFLDLQQSSDVGQLKALVARADVFSQGYRRGALARYGFGPEDLAAIRPGIIYVSINAYGHVGPWAGRPGWEQLAQSATGVAVDEGSVDQPRLIGAAATDYTTGYMAALGTMAALARRVVEGGSYHVEVSLSQTANYLYSLGMFDDREGQPPMDLLQAADFMTTSDSGFGRLHHLGPIVRMSETPPRWEQPVVPLGTHAAAWAG